MPIPISFHGFKKKEFVPTFLYIHINWPDLPLLSTKKKRYKIMIIIYQSSLLFHHKAKVLEAYEPIPILIDTSYHTPAIL